jgi:hypothetical protein
LLGVDRQEQLPSKKRNMVEEAASQLKKNSFVIAHLVGVEAAVVYPAQEEEEQMNIQCR